MKKITLYLVLICFALISQHTSATNVANTSKENFAQYGKEDAYWVVTVTCNNQNQHTVQRKTDQDTWCPKDKTDSCNEDKKVTFEYVCSDAYAETIKQAETTKPVEITKKINTAKRVSITDQSKAQAITTQKAAQAQDKALAEQKKREAEQKIQQKIYIEQSIASIQQEIQTLNNREREIQKRLVEIGDIIRSNDDDDDE